MNARTAIIENNKTVNLLIESSKELASRKGWTVEEAIDYKVGIYVKYATNGTESTAWEIRGEEAKNLLN